MKTRKYTFFAIDPNKPNIKYPIQVNHKKKHKARKHAETRARQNGWELTDEK